ncbi:hypothetical protein K3495_g401 [Podosphaera aphanis]|nr:hypothetical protein K3495_g401 [Podosphaera aphanis]
MHVALVVIDKLHRVKNWKQFRKEYALQRKIRSMLELVPFVGLTATRDEQTIVEIKERRFRFDTNHHSNRG